MTEDYKVQASVKVGANQQHMVNVRANSVEELVATLDSLTQSSGYINYAIDSIAQNHPEPTAEQALANVRAEFPGTQEFRPGVVTPNQPAPAWGPPPPAPECPHGVMKKYSGTNKNGEPYTAYFCPGPKGPNQCKPKFLD